MMSKQNIPFTSFSYFIKSIRLCSLAYFLLLLTASPAHAQHHPTIRSDRPGQCITPFTVGKNIAQFQGGADIGKADYSSYTKANIIPNMTIRYGLASQWEINIAFEYRYDQFEHHDSTFNQHGLSGTVIGTRFNLLKGHDYVPAVGLQCSAKLPGVSDAYHTNYTAPRVFVTAIEPLTEKLAILVVLGLNGNGPNQSANGSYVLNLGYTLNKQWSTFIENYGNFTGSSFEHRFDGGVAYLCSPDLQLDLYAGVGNNPNVTDYFVSAGISWRIPKAKE